jgi:hypothetical protein
MIFFAFSVLLSAGKPPGLTKAIRKTDRSVVIVSPNGAESGSGSETFDPAGTTSPPGRLTEPDRPWSYGRSRTSNWDWVVGPDWVASIVV